MKRTAYQVTVRAEPGVDDVRALRAWLKIGLRKYGLRCLKATQKEEKAMDARKYASKYVKPDSVREGPITTRIINVFEHEQYNRPVIELETGSQFTLSDRNVDVLIKTLGDETDRWVGQEIVLELGTYTDWRTKEEKETVRVRAPSNMTNAKNGSAPASKPLPPSKATTLKDDMSDEIPF